jgi:hypothetical protein
MDKKVDVLADVSYTVPMGNRNTDITALVEDIAIPMSEVGEEFYVYIFNLSDSEMQIKDHVYNYTITFDSKRLEASFETTLTGTTTAYAGSSINKTVDLNGPHTPELTAADYVKLGITKLQVTLTYTCTKRGGVLPALSILNGKGEVIAEPNSIYHNTEFLTTVKNSAVSTEVTTTFVIDLTDLETLCFVLDWLALETPANTTGTPYISVSDIEVKALLVREA